MIEYKIPEAGDQSAVREEAVGGPSMTLRIHSRHYDCSRNRFDSVEPDYAEVDSLVACRNRLTRSVAFLMDNPSSQVLGASRLAVHVCEGLRSHSIVVQEADVATVGNRICLLAGADHRFHNHHYTHNVLHAARSASVEYARKCHAARVRLGIVEVSVCLKLHVLSRYFQCFLRIHTNMWARLESLDCHYGVLKARHSAMAGNAP